MFNRFLSLLVLAGIAWPGLALAQNQHDAPPVTGRLVDGMNHFALDLYAKLAPGQENLFFSPYSIDTALMMTAAGGRGQTAAEMVSVLHQPPASDAAAAEWIGQIQNRKQDAHFQLHVANALWGQQGSLILPAFTDLLQKDYLSEMRLLDFADSNAATKTINDWVSRKTSGKIENLIPRGALNASTRLVLTNAIYFKADWQNQFEHASTRDGEFHIPTQAEPIKTPMMHRKGQMLLMENDQFQALELPYLGGRAAMLILLPRATDGLPKLESSLTPKMLAEVIDGLHPSQVDLQLPKFKMTREIELGDTLRDMGMSAACTAKVADFSGIDGSHDLFLSNVVHKAYLSVDEQGTEAAAASSVAMGMAMARPPGAEFNADHPFLFVLRAEPSGLLLFAGRLENPGKQE